MSWKNDYGVGLSGLYAGREYDHKSGLIGSPIVVKDREAGNVFYSGSMGSGKTAGVLQVNALGEFLGDSNTVWFDPKGTICRASAEFREKELGNEIVVIDPCGITGRPTAKFNFLQTTEPDSPMFYEQSALGGEALIEITGKDPHWPESAQGLVVGGIMGDRLLNGPNASLANVRRLVSEPDTEEEYTRETIGDDGKKRFEKHKRLIGGLRFRAAQMVAAGLNDDDTHKNGGEAIESLLGRYLDQPTDEIRSIRSAADTQTRWMLSSLLSENMKGEGFDPRRLKETTRPISLYIVVPPHLLRAYSRWLRLLLISVLQSLYRPGGLHTVIFIDEMAVLNRLDPLIEAFGLSREYKFQIVGIYQDLARMHAQYSDFFDSMLEGAGVVGCFRPNGKFTANWMAERAGTTQAQASTVTQAKPNDPEASRTWQHFERPVFRPHELYGMKRGTGLMWMQGSGKTHGFCAPAYVEFPKLAKRAGANPFYGK